MFRKTLQLTVLLIVCGMLAQGSAFAEKPYGSSGSLQKTAISDQQTLNGNNWAVEVKNNGQYGYDASAGDGGGFWPRGSGKMVIFAAGVYIGVYDRAAGEALVSHIEFDSEYQPGRILNSGVPADQLQADDPNSATNRVYIINSDGSGDWDSWPIAEGAPADTDGDPLIVSDQDSWCVWNDLDLDRHDRTSGYERPIGLEVQMQSYMFNASGALGNIFFMKWDITNKSSVDYDSAYVGLWYDPDLDDASNDLIGSDPVRKMGYTYNADDHDSPHAFGVDFFQGPLVDAPGETAVIPVLGAGGETMTIPDKKVLGVTAVSFYINGTDPDTDEQRYNLMSGLSLEGTPRSADQAVGGFDFPGDPVTGEGLLDPNGTDKRFLVVTGPFPLNAGDTQTLIAAEMAAAGSDELNAIEVMRGTDEVAQSTFDNGFITPKSPSSPALTAKALDGAVVLTWNNRPELEEDEFGTLVGLEDYIADDHQGYRLYRSSTGLSGSWVELDSYDANDGVADVTRTYFDSKSGGDVTVPLHIGDDSGLRYSYVDEDVINGMTYYYAVTAFDFQTSDETDRTLESAQGNNIVKVVPAPLPAGYRYDVTADASATHAGLSDGMVNVSIIDPSAVTGHSYDVVFEVIDGGFQWKLVDKSIGQDVMSTTKLDDADTAHDERIWHSLQVLEGDPEEQSFPVLDGLNVQVFGPPLEAKDYDWIAGSGSGERWVSGAGGGEVLFGGVYLAPNWSYTSTPADGYPQVEIRFGGAASFVDEDGNGEQDPGEEYVVDLTKEHQGIFMFSTWGPGTYTGFYEAPFTVWDVDAEPDRQLNVIMRDWDGNNRWDLHGTSANGYDAFYNYMYIMNSDYDPTGVAHDPTATGIEWFAMQDEVDGGGVFNSLYNLWIGPRSRPMFVDDGALVLIPNRVNGSTDVFSFDTQKLMDTYDDERATADLDDIKVVPNPYLGTSVYNMSQFDRRVKFTGLPQSCTIRIFTVSGDLVRTIEHGGGTTNNRVDNQPFAGDDPADSFTSIEEWDLKTKAGAYVASGLYVAYIDAGDIGTTFVKIAIVQEKEIIVSPVEGR
jgi:hypothetical protein